MIFSRSRLLDWTGSSSVLVSVCIITSLVSAKFVDGFVKDKFIAKIGEMGFVKDVTIFNSSPEIDTIINSIKCIGIRNKVSLSQDVTVAGMYFSGILRIGTIDRVIEIFDRFRHCLRFCFSWPNFYVNAIPNIVSRCLSAILDNIGHFNTFVDIAKKELRINFQLRFNNNQIRSQLSMGNVFRCLGLFNGLIEQITGIIQDTNSSSKGKRPERQLINL